MKLSRRDFVFLGLGGLGLLLAGCADKNQVVDRPGPLWPDGVTRPRLAGKSVLPPAGYNPPIVRNPGPTPVSPGPNPVSGNITGPVRAIPRSAWAEARPIASKILPMGGIERITVHHEGWTPVWFNDYNSVAKRLESIRQSHLERLGAGDIGYHYIIDRAGRVWQGRDLANQGAHVHDYNPHNIGVMCLGNFDLQRPTQEQLDTLRATLITLQKNYRIPVRQVFTHQELNSTDCPGKDLQSRMITLRRNGLA